MPAEKKKKTNPLHPEIPAFFEGKYHLFIIITFILLIFFIGT